MLSTLQKLEILADAAKYDASCASSGRGEARLEAGRARLDHRHGICHSYTPDGRCVSLLKILLTNACVFDCAYCINRRSSNVRRARFSVEEVVDLTLNFYKRNYIEGLFLSSGIIRSSDYTMELIVRVARSLREEHGFRGLHPSQEHSGRRPGADRRGRPLRRPALDQCRAADRDRPEDVRAGKARGLDQAPRWRTCACASRRATRTARAPRFSPAGQGTQMIVGADGANDARDRRDQRVALRELRPQAHLLLGVQPDPGFEPPAAGEGRAARARAPALSGRLALSLLRIFGRRDRVEHGRRHARSRDRSQARLGLAKSRALPN